MDCVLLSQGPSPLSVPHTVAAPAPKDLCCTTQVGRGSRAAQAHTCASELTGLRVEWG